VATSNHLFFYNLLIIYVRGKTITIINIVQGDTKKTVITKNLITSKILFRLTQNFSYIRSSLCSRLLQSFKSVLKKLFVSLALKKCAPNELPGTAGTSGSSRQSSRWPSPWDHSYCCCDCCLQVRDSLGVVATHPVLKVSPHIKIWWVKSGECGDHCRSHLQLIRQSGKHCCSHANDSFEVWGWHHPAGTTTVTDCSLSSSGCGQQSLWQQQCCVVSLMISVVQSVIVC